MYVETCGCMYADFGCMYAETLGCKVCGCWVHVCGFWVQVYGAVGCLPDCPLLCFPLAPPHPPLWFPPQARTKPARPRTRLLAQPWDPQGNSRVQANSNSISNLITIGKIDIRTNVYKHTFYFPKQCLQL